jgi:lambda family phage portal protein
MMIQSLAVDGEILLKKVYGKGKFGLQLQLLHSEQLIITRHELFDMGIKRDEYGKPVEYCLTTHHPGEGLLKYVYEPAEVIIHAYIPYQIGAPRGIPMSASAMTTIKMLDDYRKAELVAARIEASKFVVYEQAQLDQLDAEIAMEAALPASVKTGTIQPGMAEVLPPGVTAKYMDSTHPSTAFPSFNRDLKKEIAAGLGISYNSLYSDFENTSFSSMRAAFISERAFYRKIQTLFIEKILTPIFEDWLDAACVSGELDLPPVLGNYDFYKQFSFTPKAYEFSNPLQEAEAQKVLIESRVMSRSQICLERGSSYEKVLDDIKHEQELEKLKGINFEVLPKSSVVSPVPEGIKETPMVSPGPANTDTLNE